MRLYKGEPPSVHGRVVSKLPVWAVHSPTFRVEGYPSFIELKRELLSVKLLSSMDGRWSKRQYLDHRSFERVERSWSRLPSSREKMQRLNHQL